MDLKTKLLLHNVSIFCFFFFTVIQKVPELPSLVLHWQLSPHQKWHHYLHGFLSFEVLHYYDEPIPRSTLAPAPKCLRIWNLDCCHLEFFDRIFFFTEIQKVIEYYPKALHQDHSCPIGSCLRTKKWPHYLHWLLPCEVYSIIKMTQSYTLVLR